MWSFMVTLHSYSEWRLRQGAVETVTCPLLVGTCKLWGYESQNRCVSIQEAFQICSMFVCREMQCYKEVKCKAERLRNTVTTTWLLVISGRWMFLYCLGKGWLFLSLHFKHPRQVLIPVVTVKWSFVLVITVSSALSLLYVFSPRLKLVVFSFIRSISLPMYFLSTPCAFPVAPWCREAMHDPISSPTRSL